jgi:HPt (histidine-containing phosphotransfer) domain-containing protein
LDPAVVDSLRRLGVRSGRDVLAELTALFLSTADSQLEAAQQLVDRSGRDELARVAHSLKGSASVIGGRRMSAAASALEAVSLSLADVPGADLAVRRALDRFRDELELFRGAVQELSDQP